MIAYRLEHEYGAKARFVPRNYYKACWITTDNDAQLSDFLVIEPDALVQAPFVALLPQNGGRDPDTQRPIVKMDVIMEFFGETLGGSNVYDATRFPLDFCYDCGGCI